VKLKPLDPRPTLAKRAKCWLRLNHHNLQLCASAITNRLTWRCRRCTGHFARPKRQLTGKGGIWT
jgi:hypothetical protein